MRRFASLVSLVTFLFMLAGPPATADDELSVMTQNQYLGGDLGLLLTATDSASFNAALVTVLRQIAANDFPGRARRQAADIAEQEPHLVGLQEVWSFGCLDLAPSVPGRGCEDPSIAGAFRDHLPETVMALAEEDAPYRVVAIVKNIDLPGLPFQIGGFPALFFAIDRDVILARNDVTTTPVDFGCSRPSIDGCNFETVVEVAFPIGPLIVERGFVAVDASIDGEHYRFANTHLEVFQPDPTDAFSRIVQALQAEELIATLESTLPPGRPLIVVGDFNSRPEDMPFLGIVPPYRQFIDARYNDAWTVGRDDDDDDDNDDGRRPGFTCCQLADLSNPTSLLVQRIDMIFARGPVDEIEDATVLGVTALDEPAPPGLVVWPSDHGSVAAELEF